MRLSEWGRRLTSSLDSGGNVHTPRRDDMKKAFGKGNGGDDDDG